MVEREDVAISTLLEVFEMIPKIPSLTRARRPAVDSTPRPAAAAGIGFDPAEMVPIPGTSGA